MNYLIFLQGNAKQENKTVTLHQGILLYKNITNSKHHNEPAA